MKQFNTLLTLTLTILLTACGAQDQMTASSALATNTANNHPIVGTWSNSTTLQELVVHSNGAVINQACDMQATIGDVAELTKQECGPTSKTCGSFPLMVSHSMNSPTCIEPGSYVCFYNVYRASGQDFLALNCSDGKGVFYYQRK